MRLLSFLTDIETALVAETPVVDGGAWETSRMVSFHQGLARLTLAPRSGNDFPGGAILIQAFLLSDGSQSVKASLTWSGSPHPFTIAVYSTPRMNWKLEASRIASAFLEGPRQESTGFVTEEHHVPLSASA
ncbi:MAG: hypothetical protein HZC55_10345 [Verrucomicrobia bacterium]|nr:hypothetical protein [Verrucomicrobiota bacterium]